MTDQGSSTKMKDLRLPMSRVKTIMKSSPHVETIGQDALYAVTKATELFMQYLTEQALLQSNRGKLLDYKHLAEVVQTYDTLEFLRQIIPRKITVRQFKEMMAAKDASHSSSDSDSESDSDSCSNSNVQKDDEDSSDSDEESETKNDKNDVASVKTDASGKNDSEDDSKE